MSELTKQQQILVARSCYRTANTFLSMATTETQQSENIPADSLPEKGHDYLLKFMPYLAVALLAIELFFKCIIMCNLFRTGNPESYKIINHNLEQIIEHDNFPIEARNHLINECGFDSFDEFIKSLRPFANSFTQTRYNHDDLYRIFDKNYQKKNKGIPIQADEFLNKLLSASRSLAKIYYKKLADNRS